MNIRLTEQDIATLMRPIWEHDPRQPDRDGDTYSPAAWEQIRRGPVEGDLIYAAHQYTLPQSCLGAWPEIDERMVAYIRDGLVCLGPMFAAPTFEWRENERGVNWTAIRNLKWSIEPLVACAFVMTEEAQRWRKRNSGQ